MAVVINDTHIWECVEVELKAEKIYKNPFRDVDLKVEFKGPNGENMVVPGFWDGENVWKIRLTPTVAGEWKWRTLCSSLDDSGLNGRDGIIRAALWSSTDIENNPNRKGFIKIHPSGRYFTYADNSPFYWLGDTLWFIYTKRCDTVNALPKYIKDRKEKGFSVIQMVAGRPAGGKAEWTGINGRDHWYTNEAGTPYQRPYDLINPEYFKHLDVKIKMLLDNGFIPCIMGMWGWDIRMGVENAKEYWRYLIARYAAYNVLWSIAGEYFFVPDEQGWREIGEEIHKCDPYGHPTSAHSTAPHSGSRHYQNEEWYDFNLIQVGHVLCLKQQLEQLPYTDYNLKPVKPTIMSESWYENHPNCEGTDKRRIMEKDIRFATYVPLLQGCVGQSYGAHGIWNWYEEEDYEFWNDYNRPSPWTHDLDLPASRQMKYVKVLMESVTWWALEPHPEIVATSLFSHAYCAAVPGKEYVVYVTGKKTDLIVFVPGGEYKGQWYNPRTGEWCGADCEYFPYGSWWRWTTVTPDEEDWVLLLRSI